MTRDGTLTRPILATLLLVLVVDLAFAVVLALLAQPWLEPLQAIVGVPLWPAVVVVGLSVCLWAQLRYTRQNALSEAGATEVSESEYPDLHARIRRLARQANVQMPAVAVAETDVPNSFTVGSPSNAVVVVSEGLLAELDEKQLDAVLSHELAHVQNRDAAVMTLANFLPALTSDDYSLTGRLFGSASVAVWLVLAGVLYVLALPVIDAQPFGLEYTAVFVGLVGFSAVFGSVVLGLLSAPVLLLSGRLSKYREFAADRAGAVICGDPTALASALRDLDEATDHDPATDRNLLDGNVVRSLCLLPHGFGEDDPEGDAQFEIPWDSHPTTEERVDRLGQLLAEMENRSEARSRAPEAAS